MFSLNCRPSWSCEIHGLAFKVFLNIALISFYFYTFGIASVGRYLEGSIATIKKNYDIASTDFVVKPGPFSVNIIEQEMLMSFYIYNDEV